MLADILESMLRDIDQTQLEQAVLQLVSEETKADEPISAKTLLSLANFRDAAKYGVKKLTLNIKANEELSEETLMIFEVFRNVIT